MDPFAVTVNKFFREDVLTERGENTKLESEIEKDPPCGDQQHLGFHFIEPRLLSNENRLLRIHLNKCGDESSGGRETPTDGEQQKDPLQQRIY